MDGINLFTQFIALHKSQLVASDVPQHLWEALHRKVANETFDAGNVLTLMLIEYSEDESDCDEKPIFTACVSREEGIKAKDPQSIFLIDHAWTFRVNSARRQLETIPILADRMSAIMGIDLEDANRVDKILHSMWKYCHAYSILTEEISDEDRMPIWYIMDEVGSAINHSDDPNFRIVPFLDQSTQTTYSLLFPLRDCIEGEQITRDFVEYVDKNSPARPALLLPWRYTDLRKHSFVQSEPNEEYFISGHMSESYPRGSALEPEVSHNEPLKVYAEYDVLREHLTASCFELVETPEEADVLWLTQHFRNFEELSRDTPNKFVNQFPFEYVITIKDLLSVTCRRSDIEGRHHDHDTMATYPEWLPTTYNLKTELLQFVSYYQHRTERGLDNHWIVKPWNLARGLDTHITSNIAQIVRLPATNPKIAQKYIEKPALFYRSELDAKVKFDFRYMILLKSVHPLEAYVHRKFYLRFANKPFSLEEFDDYEKHFTVMNYDNEANLRHIKCDDFIQMWNEQYPTIDWSGIEDNICFVLGEMLKCATQKPPPCGIAACPQSRALFAADLMLEWTSDDDNKLQPKLLEVNWSPDCKRACHYYPDFYNDILKLLFLDERNEESFRLLTKEIS